jgi:hypothetical protein
MKAERDIGEELLGVRRAEKRSREGGMTSVQDK